MKYNELALVSKQNRKRVGRGIAAGQGKTAGRGTKGQNSRTGSRVNASFEGGQNPLAKRLPKLRGFTSHKTKVTNVFTGQLDLMGAEVTNLSLAEAGLIANPFLIVKLIVKGEVTKKHSVSLQNASEGAIELVKKAGGSFTKTAQQPRLKKSEVVAEVTTK